MVGYDPTIPTKVRERIVPTIAEIIKDHVTLTVDCIDRIYLNAYVPRLQYSGGMVGFLHWRGWEIPSPAALAPIFRWLRP